jgi:hypothetical protein
MFAKLIFERVLPNSESIHFPPIKLRSLVIRVQKRAKSKCGEVKQNISDLLCKCKYLEPFRLRIDLS